MAADTADLRSRAGEAAAASASQGNAAAAANTLRLTAALQALSTCSSLHSEPELQEILGNASFSSEASSLRAQDGTPLHLSLLWGVSYA